MNFRGDFHMHTYFSYDCMVKPEELVKRAKEVDLGLIAITDHNSIEGAIAAKEISTIPVIIGEEIKSTEGEITGLFLQEYIEPGLSPIETAKRIKAQGALVSIPHPFTGMGRSSLSRSTVESLLSYVDIVERFNARTSSKSLNNEAEDFLNSYFLKFPEIKAYMEATIKFCRKSGYVNNIFGRRSHITGINDKNYNVRNFQERAAINAPIQGSAADMMRLAMININFGMEENIEHKVKMLLQIHDELVFEVPQDQLQKIVPIIKKNMSDVSKNEYHRFSIPLTVDVNSGNNWGEAH